jgi:hypothetical protein
MSRARGAYEDAEFRETTFVFRFPDGSKRETIVKTMEMGGVVEARTDACQGLSVTSQTRDDAELLLVAKFFEQGGFAVTIDGDAR